MKVCFCAWRQTQTNYVCGFQSYDQEKMICNSEDWCQHQIRMKSVEEYFKAKQFKIH